MRFATNQMVIAYKNKSKYAAEINDSNWYEILIRPDVMFGFSDPMFDACGYRTLTLIPLAESYYNDSTIFDNLIICNFDSPISLIKGNGTYTVVMPEVLGPNSEKVAIRGGSVQLIALLERGGIDYAFEYKSIAQQCGLRYLKLPAEIGLSSPDYGEEYKKAKVTLGFPRCKSISIERVGKPIFYGITIPKNAPHPGLAAEFVNFVLSEEGQRILQDNKIINLLSCPKWTMWIRYLTNLDPLLQLGTCITSKQKTSPG